MTSLQKLKTLLNIDVCDTTKDNLLSLLLEQAGADFIAITKQTSYSVAEDLVVRMAVIKYNLLGSEGMSNQSYNGLSETYSGYDADLLKQIYAYRRAMFL